MELKEEIMAQQKLVSLKEQLNHVTPTEGVKFLMLQMISCILHFESII